MKAKRKAVFFDRDGTFIEDRGDLRDPGEVVFFPDTEDALRALQKDFLLFIVTNQSGIGKGRITRAEAAAVNAYVERRLLEKGIRIEAVYCCPHRRDEGCPCIKPNPYFLHQAERDFDLNLSESFVVGDHPHDVTLAENAGARGLYLLTGHGMKHRDELPSGRIVLRGIREAAAWMAADGYTRRLERSGALEDAANLLRQGGVAAFPTETVYGLGADAFNERAVARIFEIKRRPRFDPLIVHVADREQLGRMVAAIPDPAQALIDRFWPGPLTIVLPKKGHVPDLVTAGLSTVAVRMPGHPLALELIRRAETPIAAPSANPFGQTSPTTAQHVLDQLADQMDQVLDGGPCSVGVESTIVSFAGDRPVLLRPGGLPREDIEACAGPVTEPSVHAGSQVVAPGMLPRHYAPQTKLQVLSSSDVANLPRGSRMGLLTLNEVPPPGFFAAVEVLSAKGDLREAAAHLFGAIRRLDRLNLDLIVAHTVPESGLGLAINDRLRRAAK